MDQTNCRTIFDKADTCEQHVKKSRKHKCQGKSKSIGTYWLHDLLTGKIGSALFNYDWSNICTTWASSNCNEGNGWQINEKHDPCFSGKTFLEWGLCLGAPGLISASLLCCLTPCFPDCPVEPALLMGVGGLSCPTICCPILCGE